jgi:hypothetical protein
MHYRRGTGQLVRGLHCQVHTLYVHTVFSEHHTREFPNLHESDEEVSDAYRLTY